MSDNETNDDARQTGRYARKRALDTRFTEGNYVAMEIPSRSNYSTACGTHDFNMDCDRKQRFKSSIVLNHSKE